MIRTTSIGLDASIAMQERAEKVLIEKFPGVAYTFSRIGTAEVATDPMGVNVADTYIFYKPLEDWPKIDGKALTKDELANRMSAELGVQVPGQAYRFSQPIEMRFNEILEETRADIAVKVFGDDYAQIEKIAGEVREILEKVPGAADVEFDALGKAPLLEITPNREAMAKYNVHAEEINEAVENALAGGEPGVIIDGNRRYPIIVRMPEELRRKINEMRKLPLRTSDGGLVTLGQVADFKVEEKVNAITREMGQRRAAIMVNLRGRDVESFVLEARKKVANRRSWNPATALSSAGNSRTFRRPARWASLFPSRSLSSSCSSLWPSGVRGRCCLSIRAFRSPSPAASSRCGCAACLSALARVSAWLHRALGRGSAQRVDDGELLQPAPRSRQIIARRHLGRFTHAVAARDDDRTGRKPRLPAELPRPWRWR